MCKSRKLIARYQKSRCFSRTSSVTWTTSPCMTWTSSPARAKRVQAGSQTSPEARQAKATRTRSRNWKTRCAKWGQQGLRRGAVKQEVPTQVTGAKLEAVCTEQAAGQETRMQGLIIRAMQLASKITSQWKSKRSMNSGWKLVSLTKISNEQLLRCLQMLSTSLTKRHSSFSLMTCLSKSVESLKSLSTSKPL